MMRNLRNNPPNPQNNAFDGVLPPNVDPAAMDSIQSAMEQYGGKSREELMQELTNARRSGLIDPAQLAAVASQLSPMLNEEQRQRLQSILNQLG